jgi:ubiquinone/menaquinone biosynthesis C-methylase UbiE
MTQIIDYTPAATGWHDKMSALGYPDAYRTAIATLLPADHTVHRLLDVGCGAGDFASAYLRLRAAPDLLTLLDPSTAMLNEAASRLNGKAAETLLLNMPLQELLPYPSQDLILCAHVIDHCPDPVHAIRTLGAALAPHGALLLIVTKPHWCTWITRRIWRHHSHTPDAILHAIVAAGLVCRRDMGFASGPPARTSHAYLVTRTQPEILKC